MSNKTMRKKILVIDDQASQCRVIKKLFESYGCSVRTLDSPEEALYILEWENFDVIMTDLCMPWMSGAEFCRRIRSIKSDIRIYALSGYIDSFGRRELADAGFDGLYSKPIRMELIGNIIEED